MNTLIIDMKNESEEKVWVAFLKSLKINYKKISATAEDTAIGKAINEGKMQGRASGKSQQDLEKWLKSL